MATSTPVATNALYYNVDDVENSNSSHNTGRTTTTHPSSMQKANDGPSESLLSSSEPFENSNLESSRHNDSIGSVLFFVHVTIVIMLFIIYTIRMRHKIWEEANSDDNIFVEYTDEMWNHALPWYLISIFLNVFLSIAAMRCFTNSSNGSVLLRGSIIFNWIFIGFGVLYYILIGPFVIGLLLWWYLWYLKTLTVRLWPRIQFTVSMIEISVTMIQSNIGTLSFYAYTYLVLAYIWLFLWLKIWQYLFLLEYVTYISLLLVIELGVFFVFSLIWTSNVVIAIVRAVTAKVVGRLCLSSQQQMIEQDTTSNIVHQEHILCIQKSFGAICTMLSERRCCPSTDVFSTTWWHTGIFLGLDGTNLKDTVSNLRNFFGRYEISSCCTNYTINSGMTMVGISIGSLSAIYVVVMLIVFEWNPLEGVDALNWPFWSSLILGYTMSMTLFGIICATFDAMVVCYYRNPTEFETNHPQLFARLTDVLQLSNNSIPDTELV